MKDMAKNQYVLLGEMMSSDNQHIVRVDFDAMRDVVNIDMLDEDDCTFTAKSTISWICIAMMRPTGNGLTAMSPSKGVQWMRDRGLQTVDVESASSSSLAEVNMLARKYRSLKNSEGAVIYVMNKNNRVVKLFKYKNAIYELLRMARERMRRNANTRRLLDRYKSCHVESIPEGFVHKMCLFNAWAHSQRRLTAQSDESQLGLTAAFLPSFFSSFVDVYERFEQFYDEHHDEASQLLIEYDAAWRGISPTVVMTHAAQGSGKDTITEQIMREFGQPLPQYSINAEHVKTAFKGSDQPSVESYIAELIIAENLHFVMINRDTTKRIHADIEALLKRNKAKFRYDKLMQHLTELASPNTVILEHSCNVHEKPTNILIELFESANIEIVHVYLAAFSHDKFADWQENKCDATRPRPDVERTVEICVTRALARPADANSLTAANAPSVIANFSSFLNDAFRKFKNVNVENNIYVNMDNPANVASPNGDPTLEAAIANTARPIVQRIREISQ